MAAYWLIVDESPCRTYGTIEAADLGCAHSTVLDLIGLEVAYTLDYIPYPASPVLHRESSIPELCGDPMSCSRFGKCIKKPCCTE